MDAKKVARLRAHGWAVGTAQDFLGLSDEETALIEMSVDLAATFRQARMRSGLTQQELARRMGSSQSRVAKIEAGDPSVSLDLLVRGLLALGSGRKDIGAVISGRPRPKRAARQRGESERSRVPVNGRQPVHA